MADDETRNFTFRNTPLRDHFNVVLHSDVVPHHTVQLNYVLATPVSKPTIWTLARPSPTSCCEIELSITHSTATPLESMGKYLVDAIVGYRAFCAIVTVEGAYSVEAMKEIVSRIETGVNAEVELKRLSPEIAVNWNANAPSKFIISHPGMRRD